MDIVLGIFKNFATAWPSILMGAVIPCGVLLALALNKKQRSVTSFKSIGHGFASFFAGLVLVGILFLIVGQIFLPSISASAASDANGYIFAGGCVILFLFYVCTEIMKYFSFRGAMKSEKSGNAGLTFGCGFILAQNLLIVGLLYINKMDLSQMIGFGVLMIISGIIYLVNSTISYLLVREGSLLAGAVMAISYFMIFAVMLIFANIYITYGFVVAVLAFNLILGYVLLKKGAKEND